MNRCVPIALTILMVALLAADCATGDEFAADLPAGVKAVWDLDSAQRETTSTRERICINGLWRWQPARAGNETVPAGNWGYFKVPGCWPGITDYMQKDCQTVFTHPAWKDERLGGIAAAWYEREIAVPPAWSGRRVSLAADYVNSRAAVFVDGQRAGEIQFPGGELDLTPLCRPGNKHVLSLLVTALPLKAVLLSHSDTNAARQVQGSVARRGLCGDVFLVGEPKGARLGNVKVDTSVRKGEITFNAALENLDPSAQYTLRATVSAGGKVVRQLTSRSLKASDLAGGRLAFSESWKPDQLWDLHTPQNMFDVKLGLLDEKGRVLDESFSQRFGFREFWIDGRDFYLNGSRIFLSAVPLDNAQLSAALASYARARESLLRLKSLGINFVYTHNYGCEPGTHLSFDEVLRAADDVGLLVAVSQPHFAQYDWQAPDADQANGYARHAEFYVRRSQNHPAVVAYAMSHNATGYGEDMNPDMIDGLKDPRSRGELNGVQRALRAEAIVKRLDPGRIVYHHSSGNLGSMHTMNFYPNFVPIQELSDWYEHWATVGVKPVFMCEYGAPFSWDWGMYRGWYGGERSFGSAKVPWDFCLAEWNAQFVGDRAFQTSDAEKANLRWEAKQLAAGKLWQRWEYPFDLNSKVFDERYPIIAQYTTDNWRAFRTWGVSAISPWEHGMFWKLRDGVDRGRKELPVDWQNLQRPGFSADYIGQQYERVDLAFERADWLPTPAADALLRNNGPLLAYIAGKPASPTSKDHLFFPGETVQKQAIVINNSRQSAMCECSWSLSLPQPASGKKAITVPTGEQVRTLLEFKLPDSLPAGKYELKARFGFASGEAQDDAFTINVVPRPAAPKVDAKIALFDPQGAAAQWLARLGIRFQPVEGGADLAGYDLLIIGQGALTVAGPGPVISRVRDGLRVLVLPQTGEVLEQRLGFRVAEYGLRQVFRRVPDHPVLAGISDNELRDWRGAATIMSPKLTYELRPRYGPTVQWCGIPVPRLWRCGNRGNVASVLIEKPARGDFLPILDGGYSLQYSPLLECREGRGMILFCQLDVIGRTEADPAAEILAQRMIEYAAAWKPAPRRTAVYVGDDAGKAHLAAAGIAPAPYERGKLAPDRVLIVGPGGGKTLAGDTAAIGEWLKSGGHLVALGIDQEDAAALPLKLTLRKAEHISAYFQPAASESPLAGIGPADVHNRDPRSLPLVTGGLSVVGDGVLAYSDSGNVALCQLAPWQFAGSKQPNLRKTFRRSSFLVSRLLAGAGVAAESPVVQRIHEPVAPSNPEKRWLDGLYLDQPEEWDDPYRFFRW